MHKKIYDPVHGFIRFDRFENALITSIPFQRLYHIRQLGTAFLVYPGGTHTRFEHSLGVMEIATRIYDRVFSHLEDSALSKHLPKDLDYWRRVLRLAALCHDLGHLPLSHVAEKALLDAEGHEGWTKRIILSEFLRPVWDLIDPNRDVAADVVKIAVGPHKSSLPLTPWQRVLSHMITGDFFGSDRIDYLLRDARSTGINYGLFDYQQMIEMMRILPALEPENVMQLGIEENAIESCEALLIARHYMHKRIYKYPAVKAYAFHLSRFMEKTYKNAPFLGNVNEYVYMTDNEVFAEINRARQDPSHVGHRDAVCLLQRNQHLAAIPIQKKIGIEMLQALKLPPQSLAWELAEPSKHGVKLPFPVLMKDGSIIEGTHLTQFSIPSEPTHWIFVDPKYKSQVMATMV